jgi:DNA-binding response OmpR family regulator
MSQQPTSHRILIVDDDTSVRRFLSRGLGLEGYEVLTADCGSSALEVVTGEQPDLVVLDLMLPDMDGLAVLGKLRAANIEAPVIFLSGNDEPETRASVAQSSAADYMVKPVDFENLLGCIGRLLNRDLATA